VLLSNKTTWDDTQPDCSMTAELFEKSSLNP
jgi:hypothetical protein